MKNGVGLSLATVIIDRFLDILAVTFLFALLYILGGRGDLVLDSARFYFIATAAILLGLILVRVFSSAIKRGTMLACSIFNDRLKLSCEKFFWALINAFRDLKRLNIGIILVQTIVMWLFYIASYALLGMFMSSQGSHYNLVEIVITLFSRSNLDLSALSAAVSGAGLWQEQFIISIFNLLPPVILFLVTLSRPFRSAEKIADNDDGSFLNMLPQIDEKDQLNFLDDYFSARRPELLKKFITINRDISIIADYSSGSNASTILCMDNGEIFYRKYAFGADGDKLAEQLQWLRRNEDNLPLCSILRGEHNDDYCCYDMVYNSDASGMFPFIHSHPIAASRDILLRVLDTMEEGLYKKSSRPADRTLLEKYIDKKVCGNLDILNSSRELHDLMACDTLIINHREYKNMPLLSKLFDREHLLEVFSQDSCADIHGDLTIENIICTPASEKGFYIIDPNTGNLHDSPFLDYAKLLQSLHGGYEFMTKTNAVTVDKNRVDFIYTRSTAYDELFLAMKTYLEQHLSPQQVRSVFYHELVHWLRLLPYKLRKDPKRAAMFYAGLVMVANDVYEWFEKE
ncbi:MAG: flippase-like domain-containing protein [Oscillospiraceae bacterium]|nr:flippase-like domain-containing protein [Oscillospiraceae bacterium]